MGSKSEEHTNYARLCRAIIDLGTEVLRNVLCKEIKAEDIKKDVTKHLAVSTVRQRMQLTTEQDALINTAHIDGYTKFDITILYKLIRYLCPRITPSKGWYEERKNNTPGVTDVGIGDDVERLRILRNTLYGHIPDTCVSNIDFAVHWNVLDDIMKRISQIYGKNYDIELATLKSVAMDFKVEKDYIDAMNQLKRLDEEVNERLTLLEGKAEETDEALNTLKEKAEATNKDLVTLKGKFEATGKDIDKLKAKAEATDKDLVTLKEDQRKQRDMIPRKLTTIQEKHTLEIIGKHRRDQTYVATKALNTGIGILNKTGILVYTGSAGDGKTSHAYEIMKRKHKEHPDWKILILNDVREWEKLVDPEFPSIVLLDDVLGKTNADESLLNDGDKYWKLILSEIENKKVKVIVTVRKNILAKARPMIGHSELFSHSHTIELSSNTYQLSVSEKSKMFNKHCKRNGITYKKSPEYVIELSEKESLSVDEILYTKSLIGFPQSCLLFCSSEKYRMIGINFFKHPSQLLINNLNKWREREAKYQEKIKYCILSYMLLKDGEMNIRYQYIETDLLKIVVNCVKLMEMPEDADIENAMEDMNDIYVVKSDNKRYQFKHETILEAIAISFGRYSPDILLKYCSRKFIKEFIRSENYEKVEGEIVLELSSNTYCHLIDRIVYYTKQNTSGWTAWWTELPIVDDEVFANQLVKVAIKDASCKDLINSNIEKFKKESKCILLRTLFQDAELIIRDVSYAGRTFLLSGLFSEFVVTDANMISYCLCLAAFLNQSQTVNMLLDYIAATSYSSLDYDIINNALICAIKCAGTDALSSTLNHKSVTLHHLEEVMNSSNDDDLITSIFYNADGRTIEVILKQWPNIPQDVILKILYGICICWAQQSFISQEQQKKLNVNKIFEKYPDLDDNHVLDMLCHACLACNSEAVNCMFTIKPNSMNNENMTDAFTFACLWGREESIDFILSIQNDKLHPNVFTAPQNEENLTNHHIAAFFGRFKVLKKLIKLNSCVTMRNKSNLSVLQMAMLGIKYVYQKYSTVVANISNKSKIIDQLCKCYDKIGILKFGYRSDFIKIIVLLIENKQTCLQDLHMILYEQGLKLLHYLIMFNEHEYEQKKLTLNVINAILNRENTFFDMIPGEEMISYLNLSALLGRSILCKKILELGTNINMKTKMKYNALELAMLGFTCSDISFSETNFTDQILPFQVPTPHKVRFGKTSDFETLLPMLMNQEDIDLGDLDIKLDDHGCTIAHYCVLYNSVKLIKVLAKKRRTVLLAENSRKHKPIHLAAYLGRLAIFNILYSISSDDSTSLDCFLSEGRKLNPKLQGRNLKPEMQKRKLKRVLPLEVMMFEITPKPDILLFVQSHKTLIFASDMEYEKIGNVIKSETNVKENGDKYRSDVSDNIETSLNSFQIHNTDPLSDEYLEDTEQIVNINQGQADYIVYIAQMKTSSAVTIKKRKSCCIL